MYKCMGGFRERPPRLSLHDLAYARTGAAIWLCRNAGPLFQEIERELVRSGGSSRLDPLVLTSSVLEFLATETKSASTLEQATYLAQLLIGVGIGFLGKDTHWADSFREMAFGQARYPEGCPASPLITWAIEIETSTKQDSLAEREVSLESVVSKAENITGYDFNRWASFLLRLELSRAAAPLAKRALLTAGKPEHFPPEVRSMLNELDHSYNIAACEDTLGWALCYESQFADAKALLDSAHGRLLGRLPDHNSDQLEIQYHRAHACFWSGEQLQASQIFQEMKTVAPNNLWTKKAAELIGETKHETTNQWGFRFDVVLSFAGEDRASAEELANRLAALGLSVFYDDFERASLWGQNLYEYLTDIYQNQAKYCVVLVSKHYASKRWTRLEWRAVQARCFREQGPYCLPLQIDGTELPGLLPTTGYLSIAKDGLQAIAAAVADKVKSYSRS
jgi:hypothetical protein